MMRRLAARWLLGCMALAGCGGDSPTPPPSPAVITNVSVTGPSQLTAVGTVTLLASATDANGVAVSLADRTVQWSLSPANGVLVQLMPNGATATATVAASGTVNVVATVDGIAGQRTVTVTLPPVIASVSVTASTTTPAIGDGISFLAQAADAQGNAVSLVGRTITWSVTPSPGPLTSPAGSAATASASAVAAGTATVSATVDGRTGSVLVTVLEPIPQTFAQLSAGAGYTCGVVASGDGYCWGSNIGGRLGDGTTSNRSRPTRVAGGLKFKSIHAGMSHTCGIVTAGPLYCWGSGTDGQLGNGTRTTSSIPVLVVGSNSDQTYRTVALGALHTCGIVTQSSASGNTLCWGTNAHGELGIPLERGLQTAPTYASGAFSFASIAAGVSHTCAATTQGVVYCWGENFEGQLGVDDRIQRDNPTAVATTRKMYVVAAGAAHSCGLGDDALVYCWGDNFFGQLGDGSTTDRLTPVAAAASGPQLRLAIGPGAYFTCTLFGGSVMRCWGANAFGQQAVASSQTRPPSDIPGLPAIEFVHPGDRHACALTQDGAAWCWGANDAGQLGDGTTTARHTPRRIGS